MPATTNLEEEESVVALGNDGNASMPEQVKRPNSWRKMMMNLAGIEVKLKLGNCRKISREDMSVSVGAV